MSQYNSAINFIDLKAQQNVIRSKLDSAIQRVLDHGQYIMGPEVKQLEADLAEFTNAKFAYSCANGTDALTIALMTWGVGAGDAIFVPSFTFVATAEAPAQLGATPFFVDVDVDTFNLDAMSLKQAIIDAKAMGLNPKAIVTVDLFGQPSNVDAIQAIAKTENMRVLVDAAQSFGATDNNRTVGSMGDITTTSFFPAKPLGCYGDGGAIMTNNEQYAELIDSIRLHGKGGDRYNNIRIGVNSRLDSIQAAILIEKLQIFPKELQMRDAVAAQYHQLLKTYAQTPQLRDGVTSAWAQYTLKVKNRDQIQKALGEQGIPSVIYYPIPLHQQQGYDHYPQVSSGLSVSEQLAKSVISLPMHPYLDVATIAPQLLTTFQSQ